MPLSTADDDGGHAARHAAASVTASTPTATLVLRVRNDRAAMEDARGAVQAFSLAQQLPERTAFKLELVLEEMLMNRIEHAFAPGETGDTQVELRLAADAVVLTFEDEGVAFDPLQAPGAIAPAKLQDSQVGGLGLLLTRKAARQCQYERKGARNVFTVVLDR